MPLVFGALVVWLSSCKLRNNLIVLNDDLECIEPAEGDYWSYRYDVEPSGMSQSLPPTCATSKESSADTAASQFAVGENAIERSTALNLAAENILSAKFVQDLLSKQCASKQLSPYFPGIQAYDRDKSPISDWGEDADSAEIYWNSAQKSPKSWQILNYFNQSGGSATGGRSERIQRASSSSNRFNRYIGPKLEEWGDEFEVKILSLRNNIKSDQDFLSMTWPEQTGFNGPLNKKYRLAFEAYRQHKGVGQTNLFIQSAISAVFRAMTCGESGVWAHSGGGAVLAFTLRLISSNEQLMERIREVKKPFQVRGLEMVWSDNWSEDLIRSYGNKLKIFNLVAESETWSKVIVPQIKELGQIPFVTNRRTVAGSLLNLHVGYPHLIVGLGPFENEAFNYPNLTSNELASQDKLPGFVSDSSLVDFFFSHPQAKWEKVDQQDVQTIRRLLNLSPQSADSHDPNDVLLSKPAIISLQVYDRLYESWSEDERSQRGLPRLKTVEDRRMAIADLYNLTVWPANGSLPIGLSFDQEKKGHINCLMCHISKVDDHVLFGAPHTPNITRLLRDAAQVESQNFYSSPKPIDKVKNAFFIKGVVTPLGSTVATMYSLGFLFEYMKVDLFTKANSLLSLNSGDYPIPWWHYQSKVKNNILHYANASASSHPFNHPDHRVLMMHTTFWGNDLQELLQPKKLSFLQNLSSLVAKTPVPKGKTYSDQRSLELVGRGQRVYESSCSACHGIYDKTGLVSHPGKVYNVGTDPTLSNTYITLVRESLKVPEFKNIKSVDLSRKPGEYLPPLLLA